MEWISSAISAIMEAFSAKWRKKTKAAIEEQERQRREMEALKNGVEALLRNAIIDSYNHYEEKEYIPIYGMENILNMYKPYHDLGGNGTVTNLIEILKELPTEPPENN